MMTTKTDAELMPPPPPPPPGRALKRKGISVLEEDEYTSSIETIIERDFFPEIPKLKNQLEWVRAVNSGDVTTIRQAQLNIARRRAGLQTPAVSETPLLAATPGTQTLRTPAMTPLPTETPNLLGASPAPSLVQQQAAAAAAAAAGQPAAPKMGLDEFFSQYTSEDNDSFSQLQEQALKRKRMRYADLLEPSERPLLLEGPYSTDEYGTSGQQPEALRSWAHKPLNTLYYGHTTLKALPYTLSELEHDARAPPKRLQHKATRLPSEDEPAPPEAAADPRAAAPTAAAAAGEEQQADAAGVDPSAARQLQGTRGYVYLKTPSLAPGVEASPLMTWGDIESTPLRLEADDFPGISERDLQGPQFSMPKLTDRDTRARALAQRATASLQRKAASRGATPNIHGSTPGGRTPGAATPKALSAAGHKLIANVVRLGKKAPSADAQLRASYGTPKLPHAASTPRRGSSATPTPVRAVRSDAEAKPASLGRVS